MNRSLIALACGTVLALCACGRDSGSHTERAATSAKPAASAHQASTSANAGPAYIKLVQTAKPIIRTYHGVDASVLGIRTGMSASKAEAIAKQIYKKAPAPDLPPVQPSFWNNGNTIKAQTFVADAGISTLGETSNEGLQLIFTTPATGHTVDGILREITFKGQLPLISDIEAGLIKKYGPPSFLGPQADQRTSLHGAVVLAWKFNKNSRMNCKSLKCLGGVISTVPFYLNLEFPNRESYDKSVRKVCGTSSGSSAVFEIRAQIDLDNNDTERHKALARSVSVTMWDPEVCVNDREQARSQFEAYAATYRN